MKSSLISLFIVLSWTAALPSQGAQAAALRIPAAVYPPGAHIGYRPALTNAEMDCLWGFFCEGHLPLFHFRMQDQLHRVAGWAQFAGVQRHGRTTMAFALFVSSYDSVPDEAGIAWSKQAFLDLEAALQAQGYHRDRHGTALLPAVPQGGTLVAMQPSGKQDLVVIALWSGPLEIEGIALYDHRPPSARQTAWASLALQVHLAWHGGTGVGSQEDGS